MIIRVGSQLINLSLMELVSREKAGHILIRFTSGRQQSLYGEQARHFWVNYCAKFSDRGAAAVPAPEAAPAESAEGRAA